MVTVVIAVLLMVAGLALAFYSGQVVELVRNLPLGADLTRQIVALIAERFVAWGFLAASPVLLIIGSLVKGI